MHILGYVCPAPFVQQFAINFGDIKKKITKRLKHKKLSPYLEWQVNMTVLTYLIGLE